MDHIALIRESAKWADEGFQGRKNDILAEKEVKAYDAYARKHHQPLLENKVDKDYETLRKHFGQATSAELLEHCETLREIKETFEPSWEPMLLVGINEKQY